MMKTMLGFFAADRDPAARHRATINGSFFTRRIKCQTLPELQSFGRNPPMPGPAPDEAARLPRPIFLDLHRRQNPLAP